MTDPTPSRRSSITSRRTLQRQSSRLSSTGSALDIFGDDNAIDFNLVADGFRPSSASPVADLTGLEDTHDTPRAPSPVSYVQTPQPPPRAASPPRVTEYLKKRLAGQERSSSSASRSSLPTSRREPQVTQRLPSISSASDSTARPLSTASGLSTPASESPYNVSSEPSHPYAMYPQVSGLTRSTSTTTVQTQNRPYSGPSRPTHPYAMYPQIPASSTELEDPFSDPADIANVGFPGLGQSYARRIGPDGEEADDLIGPDGHTEQLPPYSRYPEEMHPKQRAEMEDRTPLLAADTATSSRATRASGAAATAGTVAAAAASSASAEPTEFHPEMAQSDSLLDNEEGDVQVNQGAARAAGLEGQGRRARWKAKGRRRTCWGKVPIWAWIVLVFFLVALAATLGAVIGTHVAIQTQAVPTPTKSGVLAPASTASDSTLTSVPPTTTFWETVTTTLVDATPLTFTPKNMPPLQTGTYALPIQNDGNHSRKCLDLQDEAAGWSCNNKSFLSINVQNVDKGTQFATLFAEYPENYPLLYGAQAPSMRGPALVQLMNDIQEPQLGPAYFFQQLYDKVVIVSNQTLFSAAKAALGEDFSLSTSYWNQQFNGNFDDGPGPGEPPLLPLDEAIHDINSRRTAVPRRLRRQANGYGPEGPSGGGSSGSPGTPVMTGDELWYCFWNSTILEGFIYALHGSQPDQGELQYLSSVVSEDPMMTNAPMVAMPSNEEPHWRRRGSYTQKDDDTPPSAQPGAPSNAAAYNLAMSSAAAANASPTPPSKVYPFVVKIEERRSTGMPNAYCQAMSAQRDGTIVPRRDPITQQKITFRLRETEPLGQHSVQPNNSGAADTDNQNQSQSQGRSLPVLVRDLFERDVNSPESTCICSWMFS